MLKILDITSLSYIYIYIYIYINKFGFSLSAFNLNMSFSHYVSAQKKIKADQNEPKWLEWIELDQMKQSGLNG